jgi:HAD superfamily hydrolase (TIGR01509 family)
METLRAVIFDMDGVIVDSEPLHEQAFLEVMRELGYGHNHGIEFDDYVGRSDFELWEEFIAKNKPPHSLEDLMAMKRQRVTEVVRQLQPIFAGLPELLEKLAPHCRLALASGSERPFIETVLSLKNLRRFFPVIVSAAEVEHGKPAPDVFLRTATLLGVQPEDCWVVEDSKPGVTAALAAGMRVVAITNTHPADELRDATHVVQTYEEIGRRLLATV